MTQEFVTRCWLCGMVHECATGIADAAARSEPRAKDGDCSMCWNCGAWAVFDSTVPDGIREPTAHEAKRIAKNPVVRHVKQAWQEWQTMRFRT
jgi:hypothetical protein